MRTREITRTYVVAAVLLPALLYRALIPAGFMPVVDGSGRLTLEICPGEISTPLDLAATVAHAHLGHHRSAEAMESSAAHQHGPAGTSDSSSTTEHPVPCPYALSATPGPTPTLAAMAAVAPDALHLRLDDAALVFSPTVLRAQSPRAPPTLG